MKKNAIFILLILAIGSSTIFAVPAQRVSPQDLKQKKQQLQWAVQRKYELTQRCWRGECTAKDRKELRRLAKWIGITAAVLGLAVGGTYFARSKIREKREKNENAFWNAVERAGSQDKQEAAQTVDDVRELIESGKIDVRNKWVEPIITHTPLFIGIRLLDGTFKKSPLWVAAKTGNVALVDLLLDKGAHPDIGKLSTFPWSFLTTPLTAASKKGHYEVFEKLIDRGANVCFPYERGTRDQTVFKGEFSDLIEKKRTEMDCETYAKQQDVLKKYYREPNRSYPKKAP